MKIRYIIPGPMEANELRRRAGLLEQWAPTDAQVDLVDCSPGPASIECSYEEHLSVPALAEGLLTAEGEGVDALIVGCADDPGIDALREIAVRTAVVGPGTAAMHMAAQLGERFAIITVPTPGAVRRLVQAQGLMDRLVDIGVVDIPVLSLAGDADVTVAHMALVGRALVERGADVLVLGCMSMAFLDRDRELSEELKVPVVNPARVAVGTAATMVRAGLLPSKIAYPTPPKLASGARLADLLIR